jgi:hypothetical protein
MPKEIIDKKPQYINDFVIMSGANTFTQKTINLPINPAATVSGKGNAAKVRVMEFLKVFFDMLPDTLAEDASMNMQLAWKTQIALIAPTAPQDYIALVKQDFQLVTSGGIVLVSPIIVDLTDGAGNGILVAVPQIYLGMITAGQGAAINGSVKILYRYVDVDLTEYIGIVQSQQ